LSFIIGTLAVALGVLNFFLNLDDRFTSAALLKEYMNDTNTMIRFWLWDKFWVNALSVNEYTSSCNPSHIVETIHHPKSLSIITISIVILNLINGLGDQLWGGGVDLGGIMANRIEQDFPG